MATHQIRIYFLFFNAFVSFSCVAKNGYSDALSYNGASAFVIKSYQRQTEHPDTVDWRVNFIIEDSARTYQQVKGEVLKQKAKLVTSDLSFDSIGVIFTQIMVHQIIPYWYGTPWTFEGHTSIPNQGEIACGYFVSTTLLHAGLNVNRYKLAQQLPVHEAESLVLEDSILVISHSTTEEIIIEMYEKTSEGLYFLGFDQSHVGFLLKKESNLYVLHSDYLSAGAVAIEKIEESAAFASYLRFYVCPLSTNESFLKCWLKNTVINVVETP